MTSLTSPMSRWFAVLVLTLTAGLVYAQASPTTGELKMLFEQPLMLLVLMILAAGASAFKQMAVARRSGAVASAAEYFFANWPETVITIGQAGALFATLVMTDTLNYASALGAGYAANSLADVWTGNGRSVALMSPKN